MNLIDAMKSGRRFKRPNYETWYHFESYKEVFTGREVLADDWEIEPLQEQKIELTKKQIEDAWEACFYMSGEFKNINFLCKKLGFDS